MVKEFDNNFENKELVANAVISDGFNLKGIVEYFKIIDPEGNFTFSNEGIVFSRVNKEETVLNILTVKAEDILHYVFLGDEKVSFSLKMEDFKMQLRPIMKKTGVIFSIYDSFPRIVVRQASYGSTTPNGNNAGFVEIKNCQYQEIYCDSYDDRLSKQNCHMQVDEFCRICRDCVSFKTPNIKITCYENGVVFKVMALKKLLMIRQIGEKTGEKVGKLVVSSRIIKGMEKLGTPFKSTIVKMFKDEESPLLLLFKGSSFDLKIFVDNEHTEDENKS